MNKIAIIYDFDKTLSTKNMQEYSFIPSMGLSVEAFWKEATALAEEQKMDRILAYMYLMAEKNRKSEKPLKKDDFVKMGKDIKLLPGVYGWFERINKYAFINGIVLEHYIISSGLKEIIEGCEIYKEMKAVFACEFHYDENGIADWPKNSVNYTGKTQYIFRINKGILDPSKDDELNRYVEREYRPVPFTNMIYIGDGLTDVPCMKLVREYGGYSIAVYQGDDRRVGNELLKDGRVNFITPADYRIDSELDRLVNNLIQKMAIENKLEDKHKLQTSML